MCGIAGYLRTLAAVAPATVERMLAALRQRGPDAEHAVFWDAGLQRTDGAGAQRAAAHAAVDHRPARRWPTSRWATTAGDVWIAYNGEVYDWAAAARELEAAGYAFRTRSDTEFILHAYEHWGIDCVARLRGMFAIAILDLRRQRAVPRPRPPGPEADRLRARATTASPSARRCARCCRGCRPTRGAPRARASTPTSRTARFPRRARSSTASLRLPPAHWLRYDLAHRRSSTLARVLAPGADRGAVARDLRRGDPDAHRRRPPARALPVVGHRLVGDRLPAGGDGLQPPALVHRRVPGHRVRRKRAGRRGGGAPGLPAPRRADSAGRRGRLRAPSSPTSTSRSPTRPACRPGTSRARRRGTSRWCWAATAATRCSAATSATPSTCAPAGAAVSCCPRCPPRSGIGGGGWQRLAEELRLDWRAAYVLRFSGLTPGERAWLAPEATPRPHYWRMPAGRRPATTSPTLLEIDRLNYLPDYILRKADLMTMAHGLEMRAPFLDHRFVGALVGLPPQRALHRAARSGCWPRRWPRWATSTPSRRRSAASTRRSPAGSHGDLAPRLPGLGQRLAGLTGGLLDARRVDGFVAAWRDAAGPGRAAAATAHPRRVAGADRGARARLP